MARKAAGKPRQPARSVVPLLRANAWNLLQDAMATDGTPALPTDEKVAKIRPMPH
jgi:hypothetical protein